MYWASACHITWWDSEHQSQECPSFDRVNYRVLSSWTSCTRSLANGSTFPRGLGAKGAKLPTDKQESSTLRNANLPVELIGFGAHTTTQNNDPGSIGFTVSYCWNFRFIQILRFSSPKIRKHWAFYWREVGCAEAHTCNTSESDCCDQPVVQRINLGLMD